MATNKAKRPIHLAQPLRRSTHPEQILRPKNGLRISPADSYPRTRTPRVPGTPADARNAAQSAAEPMPVPAHVYQAIAELNGGFEKVIRDLKKLKKVPFFHSERLAAVYDAVCRLRAEANQEFMMALNQRETTNVAHFEQP